MIAILSHRLSGASVALIFLFLALLALAACNTESNAEPQVAPARAPGVPVRVFTVTLAPLHDYLALPGETEARHDITLAAQRPGQVEWIGPSEGQSVAEDELIAKIDLKALQAALDRAQAAYDMLNGLAERRQNLFARNMVTKEEHDQALAGKLRGASDLREAQVNYDQGLVRAPVAGTIGRLYVDPGEYVDMGKPVAEIIDARTIRVNVNVPELDVRFIAPPAPARVTVDAWPGEVWEGRVDFVAPKADPATKTFRVRVVLDNADGRIRPGMLARTVFLRQVIPDALAVPLYSILDKGGERILFVVKDGLAQARTVTFGAIDGERIQIVKGLAAGEQVIVAGQNQVEDGTPVVVE